jgi:DNA invertase Pin-like site-specific DNA recombinase
MLPVRLREFNWLPNALFQQTSLPSRNGPARHCGASSRPPDAVNIYAEKVSSAKTDREALGRLLKRLDRGDMLVVTRLDRLARSTRDLLNILDVIGKAGATFKSLGDSWADTSTPHGRLMLTVLGGLAEFKRSLIIARTGEGRTRAKARDVQFGCPVKLTAHQREEGFSGLLRARRMPT